MPRVLAHRQPAHRMQLPEWSAVRPATTSASTLNGSSGDSLTEGDLVDIGRVVLVHYHIAFTKRWLKWVAQQFNLFAAHASRYAFFQFLAAEVQLSEAQKREAELHPELAKMIGYADRTGEDAAWNVDHPNRKPRGR